MRRLPNNSQRVRPEIGTSIRLHQTSKVSGPSPSCRFYYRCVLISLVAVAVASYNLGCLLGALICIKLGDKLGRRWTIFTGSAIMLLGAMLQASSFHISQLIVGRVITGIGNGMNTSTIPVWQSETSHSRHRGALVMLDGALVVAGSAFSYWVNFGFHFMSEHQLSWRFPLALQAAAVVPIFIGVLFLPESPRWLLMKGDRYEAGYVLSSLHDATWYSKEVQSELSAIQETLSAEKSSFKDVFAMNRETRHLHRTLLACAAQAFQQLSGINLITYYLPIIFGNLGFTGHMPSLLAALNGTEYFLAALIPLFLVEKVGRRMLMLVGAAGMSVSMIVLTVSSRCFEVHGNVASGYISVVFTFVFNSFFAFGWLGMGWLYPPEIVSTPIRGRANAMSTATNWLFNFLVVMIAPPSFAAMGAYTYLIFAIINALMFPAVHFFFPETKGQKLEDIDDIFAKNGWFSVVSASKQEAQKSDVPETTRSDRQSASPTNEGFVEVELYAIDRPRESDGGER